MAENRSVGTSRALDYFMAKAFQVTYFQLWVEWKLEDIHFCLIKKYLP